MFDYQELKFGHKKWTESADYKLYRHKEIIKEFRNRLNIVTVRSNEEIPVVEVEELLGEIEPEKEKSSRLGAGLATNNWFNEFQESGR